MMLLIACATGLLLLEHFASSQMHLLIGYQWIEILRLGVIPDIRWKAITGPGTTRMGGLSQEVHVSLVNVVKIRYMQGVTVVLVQVPLFQKLLICLRYPMMP
jgi:hypothetical protein